MKPLAKEHYVPDAWVILKIVEADSGKKIFRVLSGFFGGFTQGDSWRCNSGITKIKDEGDRLSIEGFSGSTITAVKTKNGLIGITEEVLKTWKSKYKGTIEIISYEEAITEVNKV